jgi:bifunctional DNA-binding transcriptional regulator/antitoxin component of YhaV-PrlF toxin-antitoxin module
VRVDLDDVYFITETTVTIRGSRRRTTVPKEIVERLSLSDSDRLRWAVLRNGRIIVTRVPEPEEGD